MVKYIDDRGEDTRNEDTKFDSRCMHFHGGLILLGSHVSEEEQYMNFERYFEPRAYYTADYVREVLTDGEEFKLWYLCGLARLNMYDRVWLRYTKNKVMWVFTYDQCKQLWEALCQDDSKLLGKVETPKEEENGN